METTSAHSHYIRLGKNFFFPFRRKLIIGRKTVKLTEKESNLLSLFCEFANNLLPRKFALISIWNSDSYFNNRTMNVYVSRLRRHLKEDPDISIQCVHGKGYMMLVTCMEIIPYDRKSATC